MQSFTRSESKQPSWGMGKTAALLIFVAIVSMAALVGYYYWDRLAQPRTALVERQAQQLEAKVRQDPQNADARLSTASVYLQQGQYEPAIAQYREALVLREDDPMALMGLGVAYLQMGRLDDAAPNFSRVVELSAGNEFAQIDKRLAAAYYYLGKIYLDTNRPQDAAQQLKNARGIDKTNADYLYLSAVASQKLDDVAGAIDLFSQALRFDPAFTEAYQGLSVSYKASGDAGKAGFADAMALLFAGDLDGAIGRLQVVVTADQNADAFWGLGWAYERKGQKNEAAKAYQSSLNINAHHSLAASGLNRIQNSR